MKVFVFRICYSQTDQPCYSIRAVSRKEAEKRIANAVETMKANHYEYVCEVQGEIQ